jgi:hypothetical protein
LENHRLVLVFLLQPRLLCFFSAPSPPPSPAVLSRLCYPSAALSRSTCRLAAPPTARATSAGSPSPCHVEPPVPSGRHACPRGTSALPVDLSPAAHLLFLSLSSTERCSPIKPDPSPFLPAVYPFFFLATTEPTTERCRNSPRPLHLAQILVPRSFLSSPASLPTHLGRASDFLWPESTRSRATARRRSPRSTSPLTTPFRPISD